MLSLFVVMVMMLAVGAASADPPTMFRIALAGDDGAGNSNSPVN